MPHCSSLASPEFTFCACENLSSPARERPSRARVQSVAFADKCHNPLASSIIYSKHDRAPSPDIIILYSRSHILHFRRLTIRFNLHKIGETV